MIYSFTFTNRDWELKKQLRLQSVQVVLRETVQPTHATMEATV